MIIYVARLSPYFIFISFNNYNICRIRLQNEDDTILGETVSG